MTAEEALSELKAGNQRFVLDQQKHPHESLKRRNDLQEGQAPFAVILACADSRVVPEIVFDQGLGDLFVIRVAGNVARDKVLGSIEYAVQYLGTRLVVVLGHEKCGAVTAALSGGEPEGHIGAILEHIKPAVYMAQHMNGDTLTNAVRMNAMLVSERMKDSQPILAKKVIEDGLKIVPAYYHLADGAISFFDENGYRLQEA
jgi:carbonic anhydrase